MELKDASAIANGNGVGIVSMTDAEVGVEDGAVVVDRNITDARGQDDGQRQGGVIPYDN